MKTKKAYTVELTNQETYILCKFISRSSFSTYRELAENDDQAYEMINVLGKVRQVIEEGE